jgi:hypothetical protein
MAPSGARNPEAQGRPDATLHVGLGHGASHLVSRPPPSAVSRHDELGCDEAQRRDGVGMIGSRGKPERCSPPTKACTFACVVPCVAL